MFRDIDSNRIETRASSDQLGVAAGMALDQKLSTIIDKLEELEGATTVNGSVSDNGTLLSTELAEVVATSSRFVPTVFPKVEITVTTGTYTNKVFWNASTIEKQLPKGAVVKRYRVVIDGQKRIVIDSNKATATVDVPLADFPVSVSVFVKVGHPNQQLSYEGSVDLSSEDYKGVLTLSPVFIGSPSAPSTLDDLLKDMLSKLNNIETRVAQLEINAG